MWECGLRGEDQKKIKKIKGKQIRTESISKLKFNDKNNYDLK